jgi:hypothetical protein
MTPGKVGRYALGASKTDYKLWFGRAPTGRHLTGVASLRASHPLRGPPGGSRIPSAPEVYKLNFILKHKKNKTYGISFALLDYTFHYIHPYIYYNTYYEYPLL